MRCVAQRMDFWLRISQKFLDLDLYSNDYSHYSHSGGKTCEQFQCAIAKLALLIAIKAARDDPKGVKWPIDHASDRQGSKLSAR